MTDEKDAQRVRIVDFDMPFGSMVVFMMKLVFASLPALVLVTLLGLVVAVIVRAML